MAEVFESVFRRLDELQRLKPGWHDGDGVGLEGRDLTWVRDALLPVLRVAGLSRPGVFPTIDGHLQAEWFADQNHMTLLFDLDDQEIQCSVFDLAHGKDAEQRFKRAQIASVVEFVAKHHSPRADHG